MNEPTNIADVFLNPPPEPTDIRLFKTMTARGEVTIDPSNPDSWREAVLASGRHVSPAAKEVLSLFDSGRIQAMPREQLLDLIRALMCGILNLELVATERLTDVLDTREIVHLAAAREAIKRAEASRRESDRVAQRIRHRRDSVEAFINERLSAGGGKPSAKVIARHLADCGQTASEYSQGEGAPQPWDQQTIRSDIKWLVAERRIHWPPNRQRTKPL